MRIILVNHQPLGNAKHSRNRDQLALIGSMVYDEVYYQEGFTETLAEADAYVQCGNNKPKYQPRTHQSYKAVRDTGKPVLLRDVSIMRDTNETGVRLSWNDFGPTKGLQPYDPSYDRWTERYNLPILDWQHRGDKIVVCLQISNDASLHELHEQNINYHLYMIKSIEDLMTKTDRPIVVRTHPKAKKDIDIYKKHFGNKVEYSTEGGLRDVLDDAHCLVAYNSTSTVEAALYGTPTITLNHAAPTRPISFHSYNDIEKLPDFDTLDWCRKAAFWQWGEDEMLNEGKYIWKLLRSCIC